MAEKEFNNEGGLSQQRGENNPAQGREKHSRGLWIILLAFVGFIAIVFLTHREEAISWVEDYQAGIKLAKEQNKPVLLAFFKQNIRFCTLMQQNTYNNAAVKKYVEANFVPIFIDVDKQPAIAEQCKVSYYPSHYVKFPDSGEVFGPRVGYDPPTLFVKELKKLLDKAKNKEMKEK